MAQIEYGPSLQPPPEPQRPHWLIVFLLWLLPLLISACDESVLPFDRLPEPEPLNPAFSSRSRLYPVPRNPFLADSPWPIFHQNNYAQASTVLAGPSPDRTADVSFIETPERRVSPWTLIGPAYSDGSQPVWGASSTHVFKSLVSATAFTPIDDIQIDRSRLEVHWNFLVLRDGSVVVPDRDQRRFLRFADAWPGVPTSPITHVATWTLPPDLPGKPAGLSMTFDGWLIFQTDAGYIAALRYDFSDIRFGRLTDLGLTDNEFLQHNATAIDEYGGIYIVTTAAMVKVVWTGHEFVAGWRAPYDFRGPDCGDVDSSDLAEVVRTLTGEPCSGSGTTPTLVGNGPEAVVVVIDGHDPNQIVAFWRDEIPDDWHGLPQQDRRVAGILPLPYATPASEGFTTENSPTVWNYDIAIAQWAGLQPDCSPPTGVQRVRWDPDLRRFQLGWANGEVHINSVMTYSAATNLLYGSGRGPASCDYVFYGLDWDTGEVKMRVTLGGSSNFLDQGNQHTIHAPGSLLFGTLNGIVRIHTR